MIKLFIALFYSLHLFSDDPALFDTDHVGENIATLNSESSCIVGGVNVITGLRCSQHTDLITPGIVPLAIYREDNYRKGGQWNLYSRMYLQFAKKSKNWIGSYHGPLNEFCNLVSEEKNCSTGTMSINSEQSGISNIHLLNRGGQPHHYNRKCHYSLNKRKDSYDLLSCEVTEGDNSKKVFDCSKQRLNYELLPNGNKLVYNYDNNGYLNKISAVNRAGIEFANVSHGRSISGKESLCFNSSFGQSVQYIMVGNCLETIVRADGTQINYVPSTFRRQHTYDITKEVFPDGRYVDWELYIADKNYFDNYKMIDLYDKFKDPRIGKIKSISGPTGKDPASHYMYQFAYEKDDGQIDKKTVVIDAFGHHTRYYHDQKRLTKIVRLKENNDSIHSVEKFIYGDGKNAEKCNIKFRTIENSKGDAVFCKEYFYDANQNIIEERTYGNITGHGTTPPNIKHKKVEEGAEYQVKTSEYDQRNRLIRRREAGILTEFDYVDDTSLVKAKIIYYPEKYVLRTFYEYDASGALTSEITDDLYAKNLTKKLYTNTIYGLPLTEEEYLGDRLVKRIVNTYNPQGQKIESIVTDGSGQNSYRLTWAYNAIGKVVYETDPIGRETFYTYDANSNLISKQQAHTMVKYTYDFMNRLVTKHDMYPTFENFTHYTYDKLGRRRSEIDLFGNEKHMVYNIQNQLIQIHYPPALINGKEIVPTAESKEYNLLGHVISSTDQCGNTTKRECNIFGKPYKITYPDGSVEMMTYNLQGEMIRIDHKNGSYTLFTLDSQGRAIGEDLYASDGKHLSHKQAAYDTFNKISEMDASGLTTFYEYDEAHRVTSKRCGSEVIRYTYDDWGREIRMDNGITTTERTFNNLNEMTVEKIFDAGGSLKSWKEFAYDIEGRVILTIIHTENGDAVEEKNYNERGDLIYVKDAEGAVTYSEFDYNFINFFGQKVCRHTMTDPRGQKKITELDVLGRVVSIEHKNPYGNTTKKTEYWYNQIGSKVREIESVYVGTQITRQVVNAWEYDNMNRQIVVIEGVDTKECKRTKFTYNKAGEQIQITKPDGININQTYDGKGRLSRVFSSDQTIDYTFKYDQVDHPIEASGKGTKIIRTYSPDHLLIKERFGKDHEINYEYDTNHRLTSVILPDSSSIGYTYTGSSIQSVFRKSADGKERYRHRYLNFDMQGKLTRSSLIGNAGELSFTYNKRGRILSIAHPLWKEECTYDNKGLLIKKCHLADESTFAYDDLDQLSEENGLFTHTYQNDSLYNTVKQDGKSKTYNALNQEISPEYKYNRCGNLEKKGSIFYNYDAWNRVTSVVLKTHSIYYTYDAFNRRISKKVKGVTSRFLYHGDNEIGLMDESNTIQELRVLGISSGAEAGASIALEINGQTYAPLHDQNGNLAALIDAETGGLHETYNYSAYGELEGPHTSPWTFSSKRADPETGLIYFGRRYYDPSIHRWTTPDPIGFKGGPNLYAYVTNNPLTLIDLYGLLPGNGTSYDIFGYLGIVLENIGHHLMPFPLLKDLFEFPGHLLRGQPIDAYEMSYSRDHTQTGVFKGTKLDQDPNVVFASENGICNSLEEARKLAEAISKAHGGVDVHFLYNGSRGLVADLIECGLMKIGVGMRPVVQFRDYMEKIVAERGGVGNKDLKIFVVGHSQGGMIIGNAANHLSKDIRDHMHVSTMGSASIINENAYASVHNYISPVDIVPFTDPIGIAKGLFGNRNLHVLQSKNGPLIDHAYANGTYTEALRKISKYNMEKCLN